MNSQSPAAPAPPSPPRFTFKIVSKRCCLLVAVFVVLVGWPLVAAGGAESCGDGYGDFTGAGFGWGSLEGGSRLEDVCGAGSGPFCFPSTLEGFVKNGGSRGFSFRMANGDVVSCSMAENIEERVATCKAPPVADDLGDMDAKATELGAGAVSPSVEISPPVLDWGSKALYSPSSALLSVANTHNESVLLVYDMFSSNLQFYADNFDEILLAPGQSAMINFVFLPRWLGSSSAHLVLQTSFGGFVIQATGVAIESPYKIEHVFDNHMKGSLSLFNAFDNVIHVEEITTSLSVSSGDINDSMCVICSRNASHILSDEASPLLDNEWFTVKSGELGLSWLDIRPYKQWDVPPHSVSAIVEMNMWPHFEGSVSGTICMQLRDSMENRSDTVIVPIKMEAPDKKLFRDSTGSLSVFFEPLVPSDGTGYMFSLSARNEASYLLSLVKISVVGEGSKPFQVNYMEGLILYPNSVSHIAFITLVDSTSNEYEAPSLSFDWELFILTNDSTSTGIKIPCHKFVHACSRFRFGSDSVASEDSYIGITLQQEKEKLTDALTGSLGGTVEEPRPMKQKILEVANANELILRNWRSQGTMNEMSVIEDREILFSAVQIGTYSSKWITVHNPNKKPVIMQLVLNSAVIVEQCKSDEDLSEHTLLSMFTHIDSKEIPDGFSLPQSARTEAFVHPLSSVSFGPVIFRPSKRCMWRSSALIRSNLSGVEWLPLRAFGGSPSLVLLEGSEPVRKLEFTLDLPTSANLSSWNILPHPEATSFSCSHLISKELYAKNTGEIPLQVFKMDVSGSTCGLGGFMIHNCRGFTLAPGESMKLLISYQADFSAAVVHRELELAMATGIFVIPMKAILPVYTLKLCRKSLFRSTLWILSILLLAVAFIICLVIIRITPHASASGSEYYSFIKNDKAITTINAASKPSRPHRNTKSISRLVGEGEKSDVTYTGGHSSCPNSAHTSTQSMQSRQELDLQKKTTNSDILESQPRAADLTVRVVTERGRRRKRRAAGSSSAAKFDVSGSQSGNSTPSSPLSPNTSTLKQIWSLTPDAPENSCSQVPEKSYQENLDTECAREARAPQAEKPYYNNWLPSAEEQPYVSTKSIGRPTLLSSATFPSRSWRAPGVAVPNFVASTSLISPHARAPGSKLNKDDANRRDDSDKLVKDFTYDIWGNYFSDHMLGRPKEISSKVVDASEGDSQSFFARDPQSLMMMSSACSVSPGHKYLSNDRPFFGILWSTENLCNLSPTIRKMEACVRTSKCRAPGVALPNFVTSTSSISLHARAPGSKLSKDDASRRNDTDKLVKDFTYDIWGNCFSDHMLGRPKEISTKMVDASEGDSQSFFARDPQSLMMMSSACSVSPGHKYLSNDVNHLYEMD